MAEMAPHNVHWNCSDKSNELLSNANTFLPLDEITNAKPPLLISRTLVSKLEAAACYRCEDRWAFLYKVLWRWQKGEKVVISPADPDGARLYKMVKTVQREIHKMNAFVRFREYIPPDPANNAPRFIAWFEPSHDVLPQVAEHFSRRMGQVTWMIATPQGSACWDGTKLHLSDAPILQGLPEIDDGSESLWLVYYRSIFNPARLNTNAMELNMPVRYWKNLPEGKLIPGLISDATAGAQRVGQVNEVSVRNGATINIEAQRAQPKRVPLTLLQQCRNCDLWRHATQVVPGTGPSTARIMLIGEQPGDQEDIEGKPFVGPAGQLLDQALVQAGLDRNTVYITNAVKHFKWEPRGKHRLHKTPDQQEINACSHWLEEEIAQQQPVVMVALGATALRALLHSTSAKLTPMLGKQLEYGRSHLIPTYHPSYVLRLVNKEAKKEAFLQLVKHLKMVKVLAD
jgi:DNA polymerase